MRGMVFVCVLVAGLAWLPAGSVGAQSSQGAYIAEVEDQVNDTLVLTTEVVLAFDETASEAQRLDAFRDFARDMPNLALQAAVLTPPFDLLDFHLEYTGLMQTGASAALNLDLAMTFFQVGDEDSAEPYFELFVADLEDFIDSLDPVITRFIGLGGRPTFPEVGAESPTPAPRRPAPTATPARTPTPRPTAAATAAPAATATAAVAEATSPPLAVGTDADRIDPTPVVVSIQTPLADLIEDDPDARADVTARVEEALTPIAAGCDIGFVVVEGYAERIGPATDLADAVIAILTEEFPDLVGQAGTFGVARIAKPVGQVDLHVYVYDGCR